LPLIVADADRLKDWIAAIVHRVRCNDFSCTCVRCVDLSDEFSPVVANLHLALLDQVFPEQLMDFPELLAHIEMRVAGYTVLLQEAGERAIRQLCPAPGIN
jgi:hypothetical protein